MGNYVIGDVLRNFALPLEEHEHSLTIMDTVGLLHSMNIGLATGTLATCVAALVRDVSALRQWKQNEREVDFVIACSLLCKARRAQAPEAVLKYFENEEVHADSKARFMTSMAEVADAEVGEPLLAIVLQSVNPEVDGVCAEVLALHAAASSPFAVSIQVATAHRLSVGIKADVWDIIALAKQIGDEHLVNQLAFLRDIHVVIQLVSSLMLQVNAGVLVDSRSLKAARSQVVSQIMAHLKGLREKPEDRMLFASAGHAALRCRVLDNLCDASAMLSETVRQCTTALQDVVSIWIDDALTVASVVESWCPNGWEADEELLKNKDTQQLLLTNAEFPRIGLAVECLQTTVKQMEKLNLPVHPDLVPLETLDRVKAVCARGSLTVVCTYILWLCSDKLPKIDSVELRKAEIQSVRASLKGNGRSIPAIFEPMLTKLCA